METTLDAKAFRRSLGQFATGVTIVTTVGGDGNPAGLTANSFTSVSLDPPLVLVCVDYKTHSCPVIRERGQFAVSVLHTGHNAVAWAFAKSAPDKFGLADFQTGRLGLPILPDALAVLECTVEHEYAGGDHAIFVGRVAHLHQNPDREPLLFFRGQLLDRIG